MFVAHLLHCLLRLVSEKRYGGFVSNLIFEKKRRVYSCFSPCEISIKKKKQNFISFLKIAFYNKSVTKILCFMLFVFPTINAMFFAVEHFTLFRKGCSFKIPNCQKNKARKRCAQFVLHHVLLLGLLYGFSGYGATSFPGSLIS